MPIEITENGVGIPFLRYSDFALYLECHRNHVIGTLRLEREGRHLSDHLLDGTATEQEVIEFFESVCDWGGNQYDIKRQVKGKNSASAIFAAFSSAAKLASDRDSRVLADPDAPSIEALRTLCELRNLGISYGSKILRLLRSDLFGVRDSKVGDFVSYEKEPTFEEDRQQHYETQYRNFAKYSRQCIDIAELLNGKGIDHPDIPEKSLWDAGDVDAVIFTKIRLLQTEWTCLQEP